MTTHAMIMVVQEKIRSYVERAPIDDLIPLAIDTYECLHFCFDSFFTTYAQTTIERHQRSSLVPLMFFFLQSTTHVHNFAICASHNNSLAGCYTWSSFVISSTHHN
jgi:hypothetical protein